MQYILAILFGILFLSIIIGKWMRKSQKKIDQDNYNRHTKEEIEFFKGEMKVNSRGRLVPMDDHFRQILNDEQ